MPHQSLAVTGCLPDAIRSIFPDAVVKTSCTLCRYRHIHLIRNTFQLIARKYWNEIRRDIKTDLRRSQRRCGPLGIRRADREVGITLPGGDRALGQCLGGARPVPRP